MSAPNQPHQDGNEPDYQVQGMRREQSQAMHSRRFSHEKPATRPAGVNGIHRRRNKRWSW
jgi:hypothetical protein